MEETERSVIDMIQQHRLRTNWPVQFTMPQHSRPSRHRVRNQKEVNKRVALMTGLFVVWMQAFCLLNMHYIKLAHGDWNQYPEWLTKAFYCIPVISYIALYPSRNETKMEKHYKFFMCYINCLLVASRLILGAIDSIDKSFISITDTVSMFLVTSLLLAFIELVIYTIWLQRDHKLQDCQAFVLTTGSGGNGIFGRDWGQLSSKVNYICRDDLKDRLRQRGMAFIHWMYPYNKQTKPAYSKLLPDSNIDLLKLFYSDTHEQHQGKIKAL